MSSLTSCDSSKSNHILVFPYPAQGHMLPLLDFTHQLALQTFTITILVTPKNLPSLTPLLSAHPTTVHPLVLPFPPHPSIPSGVENIRDIGHHGNFPTINALSKLHDPIVQWFGSHPNPPSAIISDFFLGWTLHLARGLGVPRVAFFSSGAFTASVLDHFWSNTGGGSAESAALPAVVEFRGLPRSPCFTEERLPSILRVCRRLTPETAFVKDVLMANLPSWGCVFNTFEGLEGEYLSNLRRRVGHERIYGVGPLSLLGVAAEVRADWGAARAWLDGFVEDSVLYVCFGSQKLLNGRQMEALASGLEASGVRFLWVVKTGNAEQAAEGNGVVPDGFEERVGKRGMVIRGWAPQVEILGHKAVGGFLSHCGWNSTLEGAVAGVRILGWPMEADQHVNARLLVEDMGVAVRVCEGADAVPDPAQLAKVIAEAMTGDVPEKARAEELKDKALEAVRAGGSSLNQFNEFVRELRQLPKPVSKLECK